jgi:hypothetical protein
MDRNDDPVNDPKIGDQSGQESQSESMEARFPMDGVKQGDKRKPRQKLKIEIWKRKDEKHSGEQA